MSEQPNQQRNHIVLPKVDLEPNRYKTGGGKPFKRESDVEHGIKVNDAAFNIAQEFEDSKQHIPPEFDPTLIFRLRLDKNIEKDEWRKSGLTLLGEEPGKVVVLFSNDEEIQEFRSRIGAYSEGTPEGQKGPSYAWIASLTDEFALWGRDDRIGSKLAKIQINPGERYRVDVELWHYGADTECKARLGELEAYTLQNGGEFLDSFLGEFLTLARININGSWLDRLLDVGIVQLVDLPPEPLFRAGSLINTRIVDFDAPIKHPPEGSPRICIVDSGINTGHPMLGPAIGDSQAFFVGDGDVLDRNGHGTMVAGIALYGDVEKCIENLHFTPQFSIFSARVTNEHNRFDEDRLIVNQMHDAITYFHDEFGCRIFNVSLGDPELVYRGGRPSHWASVLDHLARELDIVIVVSAGNIPILGTNGEDAERFLANYPQYLLDDNSGILEPGTAANAITVGSLAHTDQSRLMIQHPNDPAIRCIAGINQPSPFTRKGPGVNNGIKPDVVDFGGNATWDGRTSRILEVDPEASVVSMNFQHLERLFKVDVGTSYATAKVTHLAGMILSQYPDWSANLVRAIIASSADIPGSITGILDDQDDQLRLCGYGKPDLERALYSTNQRVTLIAEDDINIDALHLYKIPIPEEFKQANGHRRISVSLAFDPPVRHTRKDYLGVKMDFRLFRGITTQAIIDWHSERPSKDADPDKIDNRYKCQTIPSVNRRGNGTLQKGVFTARVRRSLANYDGENLHLLVRCKTGWALPDEYDRQRYALAVTMEHLTEPIELYNVVEQRVRQEQRVRIRA